ncbi:MAG: CDP-diacylglycerol--glycerol-3-phosphate 3-phosphatidyltransferase [Cyanobacteria bacterium J06639_1]
MNLPTWITLSRLLVIPVVLVGMAWGRPEGRWVALGAFLLGAGTDWLDGYLARRLDMVTDLGKFLDPLVDKLLVLAPLLALVEARQIPAWGVFLAIAREFAITGWRIRQPKISGANGWGKAKTVSQILAIALLIARAPGGVICFWIAVALTLWSGLMYVVGDRERPASEIKPDASQP